MRWKWQNSQTGNIPVILSFLSTFKGIVHTVKKLLKQKTEPRYIRTIVETKIDKYKDQIRTRYKDKSKGQGTCPKPLKKYGF